MSPQILPPDFDSLLPPLLACLHASRASALPPPALLALVSPSLRQRLQHMSEPTDDPDSPEHWLCLLCREPESGTKLSENVKSKVNSNILGPHPVSNEFEPGEVDVTLYRQLDVETFQAKVGLLDLDIMVMYTWCTTNQESTAGEWRVSEVMPPSDSTSSSADQWQPSIEVAQQAALRSNNADSEVELAQAAYSTMNGAVDNEHGSNKDQEEDDSWAKYDKGAGETPAGNRCPMPGHTNATNGRARTTSEAAYFERYSTVQPEMDNDDPSEDQNAVGESSLNGNILANASSRPPIERILPNGFPPQALTHDPISSMDEPILTQPRASPPDGAEAAVPRLEDTAALQSNTESAIRHHVSTSIKNLFRLCRNAGIDRADFDDLVKTELETLSMLAEDD